MHARTGFAAAFTHASEGNARAEDIATTICAVLVAEATNTGFEPLVRPEVSALRRSRLSWVKQNFMRAETLTAANAPAASVGSVLTLTNSLGFALSALSIELFVRAAQQVALAHLLPWLALGPAMGLLALRPLLR